MIDVEHSKTLNRVEVLSQVNSSLEEDRKNLMSHVTVLLSQYHELLTQTIDDKEHFHEEEKVFYEVSPLFYHIFCTLVINPLLRIL